MGKATLRQKVLPFDRPLERFGQFDIVGPHRYDIVGVRVGARAAPSWSRAQEYFAPGDFEILSQTEKLSRDSFERMDAGVSVGAAFVDAPVNSMKIAEVVYETRIIDSPWDTRGLPAFVLSRAVQILVGMRSAKAASLLWRGGRFKFARDEPRSNGITLGDEVYAVATVDTLTERSDIAPRTTKGAAKLAIKDEARRGRPSRGLHVVPAHELQEAA
jgi:hypothetical protein